MTEAEHDRRWLPFEGTENFRDIGGYEAAEGARVKWDTVFRSGSLTKLSNADLERLGRIGLQLVCDLRTAEERQTHPSRLPGDAPPRVVSLSVKPESESELEEELRSGRIWERLDRSDVTAEDTRRIMCKFYRSFVLDRTTVYSAFLKELCHGGNRPALVHCAGGKDRTGVAIALLLRTLGTPMETVVEDYALTNRVVPLWAKQAGDREVPAHIHAILQANPDFLQAAFTAIDERYGSFDGYLQDGLLMTGEELDALRSALLE